MDKFTISYVLIVSLTFLGWSSFKIWKAFGKKGAITWAIALTVWFILIGTLFFIIVKQFHLN